MERWQDAPFRGRLWLRKPARAQCRMIIGSSHSVGCRKQRSVAIQADMLQFEPSKGKNSVVVEDAGTLSPCDRRAHSSHFCCWMLSSVLLSLSVRSAAKKGVGMREVSPGQGFWRSQVDHMAHYLKQYLRTQDALQVGTRLRCWPLCVYSSLS
jgi:hypothetical protein